MKFVGKCKKCGKHRYINDDGFCKKCNKIGVHHAN